MGKNERRSIKNVFCSLLCWFSVYVQRGRNILLIHSGLGGHSVGQQQQKKKLKGGDDT